MGGSLRISVEVDPSGPLLDGGADGMLAQWQKRTGDELGSRGVDLLKAFPMNKTGRARGGFAANLKIRHAGAFVKIPAPTIEGVTWGPWLEGTSSRNRSTSFGGYHLFEQTGETLQGLAVEVGDEVLASLIAEIGGTP